MPETARPKGMNEINKNNAKAIKQMGYLHHNTSSKDKRPSTVSAQQLPEGTNGKVLNQPRPHPFDQTV